MLKNKLLFLLFLLRFSIGAEIVGVPHYNYSIYPLEGWKLQGYSSDAELSWMSAEMDIACSVSAYEGSMFSSVEEMFSTLSLEYNGEGGFYPFIYQGMDAVIGEIKFEISGKIYKGWLLFMNGDEFDYHLNAFSLYESYEESQNEILSVIDSFAYGKNGTLNMGPVSTFLDSSNSKNFQIYTMDFFDHPLHITSSEYDFNNAQTIIEREAEIMNNYSEDPDRFYEAWKRYYKLIFRDNYSRLEPLYQALYPYLAQDRYTEYDLTEIIMFWLQTYTYEREGGQSDLLSPLASSSKQVGDCDARSLIMGILLHKFGIQTLLLTSEKVKHAMIAAKIPGEGVKYIHNNDEYLRIELTKKALIGEITESIIDESLWTPVEMEYTHGF